MFLLFFPYTYITTEKTVLLEKNKKFSKKFLKGIFLFLFNI